MNILHDIDPKRITSEKFDIVIEISKGSKAKYEIDKVTGILRLDRFLYTSTVYPANYGFIPRTLAEDGDALDALLISAEPIIPMTLVSCKPIGMIKMFDGGVADEKIICVATGDPNYKDFNDISELPKHLFEEAKHFFEVYKKLENKVTDVERLLPKADAVLTVQNCIQRYLSENK